MFEIGSSAAFVASVMLASAIGFVFSGIAFSSYAVLTNRRLRFESVAEEGVFLWSRLPLLLVSGPVILVQNSWKAAIRGLRPRFWLLLSAMVAWGWSFCTGLVILNVMILLQRSGFWGYFGFS